MEGNVAAPLGGETTMAMVIYVLYLVGLATAFAAVVGVVLAHGQRSREVPGRWLDTAIPFPTTWWW